MSNKGKKYYYNTTTTTNNNNKYNKKKNIYIVLDIQSNLCNALDIDIRDRHATL